MNCNHCGEELEEGKFRCVKCGQMTFENEEDQGPEFMSLADVEDLEEDRVITDAFFSALFGGGFVESQRILIGGEAGGGKSTWSLQVGEMFYEETGLPVLYLATEEKPIHIKARCRRLGIDPKAFLIVCQPLDEALECLDNTPEISAIFLDSLPDLIGPDPNVAIEVLARFAEWSEENTAVIFVIDHVNKGEELAGLYRLRHTVDTTVYLRYDGSSPYRVMEIHKNRHGQSPVAMKLVMRDEHSKRPGYLDPAPADPSGKRPKRGFITKEVTLPPEPKKKSTKRNANFPKKIAKTDENQKETKKAKKQKKSI